MYLKLKFENAKLFRPMSKGGFKANPPKTHHLSGPLLDRESYGFVEPITVNQISNIIHVLMGERPVPSFKWSVAKHNDYYYEKAKNSFIKFDNLLTVIDKKNEVKVIKSFISTAKAMGNSNVKQTYYTWTDIEYFLSTQLNNPENLKNFDEMLSQYKLDRRELTFIETLNYIFDSGDISHLFECLSNITNHNGVVRKGLYNDVLGYYQKNDLIPKTSGRVTINNYTFESIRLCGGTELRASEDYYIGARYSNGVASYENLCGEIMIPVTNEDLEKINQNIGYATLLDGGFVYILGVGYMSPMSVESWSKVGEISLEEIKID